MNQATVTTLIAINVTGIVLTLGMFGTMGYFALKAKKQLEKDVEAAKAKAEAVKTEFRRFMQNLERIS